MAGPLEEALVAFVTSGAERAMAQADAIKADLREVETAAKAAAGASTSAQRAAQDAPPAPAKPPRRATGGGAPPARAAAAASFLGRAAKNIPGSTAGETVGSVLG